MGGLLWIIVVGFIAGLIARWLAPGPNNPSGFILTTILGIAGAFLATFIGQAIGHYSPDQGAGFIMATIGAVVVLFIWHRLVASGVIKGWRAKASEGTRPPHRHCRGALATKRSRVLPCEARSGLLRFARNDDFTSPNASPHPCARPRRSCCWRPASPGSRRAARCLPLMMRPSAAPSPRRCRAPAWRPPRRDPW